MNIRKVLNLFISVFATAVLLTSNAAFAEATLTEVYQAVQSGQLAKADAMMQEVLKNHPNSAKAHYVAAELSLKEGKVDAARNHFMTAQNLAPGLPFAKPESVQKLQVQLVNTASSPIASSPASIFSNPIFWGLIAILVVGVIIVMRRRKAQAVQVYNAPSAGYPGAPGGPAGQPGGPGGPYPSGPGMPGAPAAGMGGGLMGSLATGAALGVGMYAGQALASNLMGGHDNGHSNANTNANPNMNQIGGPASSDSNFGVRDGGSWDDGGSSSWDDGGDFMSDV